MAAAHLRALPVLPPRPGEPLHGPRFTGWDQDGGYAELTLVPEAFAYRLPEEFDDEHAAPLLCAGIVGYRALRLARLPPGGRLGTYGFGASAHLAAQVALQQGAEVHVMTRSAEARELARELGVAFMGEADEPPPVPLDAAVLFAPVGTLVPPALRALDRSGTLAVVVVHESMYGSAHRIAEASGLGLAETGVREWPAAL